MSVVHAWFYAMALTENGNLLMWHQKMFIVLVSCLPHGDVLSIRIQCIFLPKEHLYQLGYTRDLYAELYHQVLATVTDLVEITTFNSLVVMSFSMLNKTVWC